MPFKKVFLCTVVFLTSNNVSAVSLPLLGIGTLATAGAIGLERTASHFIASVPELRVPYFFLGGMGVQYLATFFNKEKVEGADAVAKAANKTAEFGGDAFWAAFCASMGVCCFQARETRPVTALIGCICALQGAPAAVRCVNALFGK